MVYKSRCEEKFFQKTYNHNPVLFTSNQRIKKMSAENTNLNNFLKNFEANFMEMKDSVSKNEWGFDFDDISDILYFSPKNRSVSNDSILVPAGETYISARVAKSGKIEAIVIENFGSMFISDNQEFQSLYNQLTGKREMIAAVTMNRACTLILHEIGSALNPGSSLVRQGV